MNIEQYYEIHKDELIKMGAIMDKKIINSYDGEKSAEYLSMSSYEREKIREIKKKQEQEFKNSINQLYGDGYLESMQTINAIICPYCKCEVDLDTCHCGMDRKNHRYEEHSFVPIGCRCGYEKPRSPDIDFEALVPIKSLEI